MQLLQPSPPPMSKMEKAFWKFHNANPHVYEGLEALCYRWVDRRGAGSFCGIGMLYETLRWNANIQTGTAPKLSNNHRAYYSRLLEEKHPEWKGMFKKKKQRQQATIGPSNDTLPDNNHMI